MCRQTGTSAQGFCPTGGGSGRDPRTRPLRSSDQFRVPTRPHAHHRARHPRGGGAGARGGSSRVPLPPGARADGAADHERGHRGPRRRGGGHGHDRGGRGHLGRPPGPPRRASARPCAACGATRTSPTPGRTTSRHAAGTFSPNDTYRRRAWNSWQWNFAGRFGVNAPAAWANARANGRPGGKGVKIAVLDSGIAYRTVRRWKKSPDFAGTKFLKGYDFVGHDATPIDFYGHGTHVAGHDRRGHRQPLRRHRAGLRREHHPRAGARQGRLRRRPDDRQGHPLRRGPRRRPHQPLARVPDRRRPAARSAAWSRRSTTRAPRACS